MAALVLCCYAQPFTSCGEWGLLSSCSTQASHYGSFSCCRAQTLGMCTSVGCSVGSIAIAGRLGCSAACGPGLSRSVIESMTPALAGWFPTTGPPRNSPIIIIFPHYYFLNHLLCLKPVPSVSVVNPRFSNSGKISRLWSQVMSIRPELRAKAWVWIPFHYCRFVVYSYKYVHADGRVSYPLCFIFSSPVGEKGVLDSWGCVHVCVWV